MARYQDEQHCYWFGVPFGTNDWVFDRVDIDDGGDEPVPLDVGTFPDKGGATKPEPTLVSTIE